MSTIDNFVTETRDLFSPSPILIFSFLSQFLSSSISSRLLQALDIPDPEASCLPPEKFYRWPSWRSARPTIEDLRSPQLNKSHERHGHVDNVKLRELKAKLLLRIRNENFILKASLTLSYS